MDVFVKHYLQQGVDHIYIVNNNSTDGIEDFVACHVFRNSITLINDPRDLQILQSNEGNNGHCRLMNENLYDLIKRETEWAIFIDADEFMYGKNGETIKTFLRSVSDQIGCIYVLWTIINPVLPLTDGFSLQQNTKRVNYDKMSGLSYLIQNANDFGKSIVRTSMLNDGRKLWIHKIYVDGVTMNNYGMINTNWHDNSNGVQWSEKSFQELKITMNHYAIRNASDLEKKKSQLTTVSCKTNFIQGLIDMLELPDEMLVEDTYVAQIQRM